MINDPNCPECKGTGERDSGGTHPWGEPAMLPCDCRVPAPAVPDDVAKVKAMESANWKPSVQYWREKAEAQAAELARYREALGPFAAVAEHDIGDDETDGEAFRPMQFLNRAPKLTVGDLRRARAALTQPTGDRS